MKKEKWKRRENNVIIPIIRKFTYNYRQTFQNIKMNKCQHNYITETISEDVNKSFNTYDFRSNNSNLPVFIITLSSI